MPYIAHSDTVLDMSYLSKSNMFWAKRMLIVTPDWTDETWKYPKAPFACSTDTWSYIYSQYV